MAILGIPVRNKKERIIEAQPYYHYKTNYSNHNAVGNLIHYITRTRANETRQGDLLCYGVLGAVSYLTVEDIIQQFMYVQNVYAIDRRGGRRMHHEVLNLYDVEVYDLNYDINYLWQVGYECSRVYFLMGFQVVFAVHKEEAKRYHIHFAVSSINFYNGRKFHTSLADIKERQRIFNEILYKYQMQAKGAITPLYAADSGMPLSL